MAQSPAGAPRPATYSPLKDPWPPFLDHLDSNPQLAWEEFYVFAWRAVRVRQPVVYRQLPKEDREDVFEQLVQELQTENFRRLRTYRNIGKPFAAWFWRVLQRRALDHLKYMQRRAHEELSDTFEQVPTLVSPERLAVLRELLTEVSGALEALSPQYRLLLLAAAEGYQPKELETLLGLATGKNKDVSDQLRYCRRKLRDQLGASGISVELPE